MSKFPKCPDDTAEVQLGEPCVPTQPPSVDPATLRRAMKYGQKARTHYPTLSFRDVEAELKAGWQNKSEATDWEWVRAAVRAGFEQDAPASE